MGDAETVAALRRAFAGEDLEAIGNGRHPDAIARAAAIVRTLSDILYHPEPETDVQQQLENIAAATAGAVTTTDPAALTALASEAGKGVRILEALARSFGPHTIADVQALASGSNPARAQVVLKDLAEALNVILTTS